MTGELIHVGDTTIRFLVEGDASSGSAAVFETAIGADGSMPAPHIHQSFEETVYGLEGVSTWTVDGTTVDVTPGQALCIRRRVVEHFDNRGDVDAKVLAIITPGVLGPSSFREVAAVFADDPAGPPDVGADRRGHAAPRIDARYPSSVIGARLDGHG